MTNKVVSIRAFDRIRCVWNLTGDPRTPLTCSWLDGSAPQGLTSASSQDDVEGELPQCA